MKNEPVAWIIQDKYGRPALSWKGNPISYSAISVEQEDIPLYTHPHSDKSVKAKTQSHTETAVKILNYLGYAQEPSKEEGADARRDKLVEIISQSHSAKTYEDAIEECAQRAEAYAYMSENFNVLAHELRAILRKAQENE